ncbi:MAG: hypothetical protein ACQETD_06240 [Pseudomonadota bacterium]
MNAPQITTAIPKRRYQLGDFSVTVLGEVESGDGQDYRYIFAMMPEGNSDPDFYVVAIRQSQDEYLLKLITPNMEKELDVSGAWSDLDIFCDQAISLAQQVLGLKDEAAHRLM